MSRRSAQVEEINDDDDDGITTTDDRFTELAEDEFDDDVDFDLPDFPTTKTSTTTATTGPRDEVNPQGIQYVQDTAQFKTWICLYPIYFDAGKSAKQGRRVAVEQAVASPLAKTVADAAKTLGFSVVFEPQKTHPADWSNPGRVRVQLKADGDDDDDDGEGGSGRGRPHHARIRTRGQLLAAVATYLRSHPTTESDPKKVPVPGMMMDDGGGGGGGGTSIARAAVPKGMKINPILPLHSPAMAGGGMQAEGLASMMGSMFPGMQGMLDGNGGGGGGSPADDVPAPARVPAGPPKKPKMKRQIIR